MRYDPVFVIILLVLCGLERFGSPSIVGFVLPVRGGWCLSCVLYHTDVRNEMKRRRQARIEKV